MYVTRAAERAQVTLEPLRMSPGMETARLSPGFRLCRDGWVCGIPRSKRGETRGAQSL